MSIGNGPPPKRYYTDEYLEWLEILKATETNPTLKDAADQLRVLYNASKEQEPYQEDRWAGTSTADDSYESILTPTETGVWKGIILG